MLKFISLKLRYYCILFVFAIGILCLLSGEKSPIDIVEPKAQVLADLELSSNSSEINVTNEVASFEKNVSHTVKSGDALYNILSGNGISPQDIDKISKSLKRSKISTVLHVREVVDMYFNKDGNLKELFIYGNPKGNVAISPNGELFIAELQPLKTFKETVSIASEIKSSFYKDALKAGASNNVVKSFINSFGTSVNFQKDIRHGDKFELSYEVEKTEDGKIVKYGPLQRGTITARGKKHQVYRYVKEDGSSTYINEKGFVVKRVAFRKPVNETRISGRFGIRKKHPIHGDRRMHKGVDYAAPTGTSIAAAADGTVVFVKTSRGGYGKHIKIKHNGTYSTLYGHMSKFAKGMKSGTKVKQGQVIGYVGATGGATGPHLHYEVHRNGIHIDPLKVTFAEPASKLSAVDMKKFLAQKSEIDKKFNIA